jgi:hypothetical protein
LFQIGQVLLATRSCFIAFEHLSRDEWKCHSTELPKFARRPCFLEADTRDKCHNVDSIWRDATANLRYKFGEDLRSENPAQSLRFNKEDALRLPRRGLGAHTLLATGDCFFVYPTKLREYQSRYRGSFLHGGVTPEECILPVSLLTPRR